MSGTRMDDAIERLVTLEERVLENHTPELQSLKEKLDKLDHKVWMIVVILAANFGTSILTFLK